jgi:hypothetical protein
VRGAADPSAAGPSAAGPSLYDDVLRVVFGFLPFRVRAHVASVTKQWNRVTATGTVKGLCEKRIRQWSDVALLGRSAVARNHLTKLVFVRLQWPSNQELTDLLAPLPSFRKLTYVRFRLLAQPSEAFVRILRECPMLRVLDCPPFRSHNTTLMRLLLKSRYPMPQLRDIGSIHLDSSLAARLSKCAPNLTVLNVQPPDNGDITRPLSILLPNLHHLKRLHIWGEDDVRIQANLFIHMSTNSLSHVTFTQCVIDESMVAWLMTLPKLVTLCFGQCEVPNFSEFAHPKLSTFRPSNFIFTDDYPIDWYPKPQHNPNLRVSWGEGSQ